jgi:hypothetical protein
VTDSDACETSEEINGGDEIFLKSHCDSLPDVLKAISTLRKFIEKMDGPIACKLEGPLCSLNMQLRLEETRNLKDTHLTSYFNNRSYIFNIILYTQMVVEYIKYISLILSAFVFFFNF